MLAWSERFATHIERADEEHKQLFKLLDELTEAFRHGDPGQDTVDHTLQSLLAHADRHFVEEELLMLHLKVDARHVNVHRMEHKSFIYDVKSMVEHLVTEDDLADVSEKLVRFITSWLVFHILGLDQSMAAQMVAIKKGATPEQAYEAQKTIRYDHATAHLMLKAVLDLWHVSLERCHRLEARLAALTGVQAGQP